MTPATTQQPTAAEIAPEPCSDLSITELIEWLYQPQHINGILDPGTIAHMESAARLIERLRAATPPVQAPADVPIIDALAEPDIVKRLRTAAMGQVGPATEVDLMLTAADEIERLRAAPSPPAAGVGDALLARDQKAAHDLVFSFPHPDDLANGIVELLTAARADREAAARADGAKVIDALILALQACEKHVKQNYNASGGHWNDPLVWRLVRDHIEPTIKIAAAIRARQP